MGRVIPQHCPIVPRGIGDLRPVDRILLPHRQSRSLDVRPAALRPAVPLVALGRRALRRRCDRVCSSFRNFQNGGPTRATVSHGQQPYPNIDTGRNARSLGHRRGYCRRMSAISHQMPTNLAARMATPGRTEPRLRGRSRQPVVLGVKNSLLATPVTQNGSTTAVCPCRRDSTCDGVACQESAQAKAIGYDGVFQAVIVYF